MEKYFRWCCSKSSVPTQNWADVGLGSPGELGDDQLVSWVKERAHSISYPRIGH